MRDTTVALAQMAADCADLEGNLRTVESLSRRAAEQKADLVCFPELSVTGYSLTAAPGLAQPLPGPIGDRLCALSRELGLTLLAGLAERRDGGLPFITQLVCLPDGSSARYRKTHTGRREQAVFDRGDSLPVIPSPTAALGVLLCADAHHPEAALSLSLRGAELLLVPFASPARSGDRRALWMKFLPARAYDSRVFLGCCNLLGDNGLGTVFGGGAMVFGPGGEIVAEDFSGREGLLLARLPANGLRPFRRPAKTSMRHVYFPAGRRPELYD